MVDEGCLQLAHHVRPWLFLISYKPWLFGHEVVRILKSTDNCHASEQKKNWNLLPYWRKQFVVDEGCPQLAHHVRPWGFLISRGDFGIRPSFLSAHRLPALDQGSVRLQVAVEAQKTSGRKPLTRSSRCATESSSTTRWSTGITLSKCKSLTNDNTIISRY